MSSKYYNVEIPRLPINENITFIEDVDMDNYKIDCM
jgi:hypothetical protein